MFEFTCIKSVNWYAHEISDSIKAVTGAVNKSIRNYTGILSQEEYLKNFNWVATWFKRNKIEFLEHFSAFIIPYLIVISFNLKKTLNSHRNFNLLEKNNVIFVTTIFFFIFIGLFFWFIKSPVIRFGVTIPAIDVEQGVGIFFCNDRRERHEFRAVKPFVERIVDADIGR